MKAIVSYRLMCVAAFLLALSHCCFPQGKFFGGDASGFVMAEVSEVLPVEWLELKAVSTELNVQVHWQTATETDNDFFAVERGSNGASFIEIGTVKGSGTKASISTYQFIDHNPSPGGNYYRIRQVDYDGKFGHSPVAFANFSLLDTKYFLHPNPASDVFHLCPKVENASIAISSLDGTVLKVFNGNGPFSVAGLKPGAYIVKINTARETVALRLIVQ